MTEVMTELPLAIFTTLMPLVGGMFLIPAAACLRREGTGWTDRADRRLSAAALALCAVAFVAASFHLGNPRNAMNVVYGIGRSPLSNEVLASGLFALVVLAYAILSFKGKAQGRQRAALLAVLASGGLAVALFCGLAYRIDTIPSWSSGWILLQECGFYLVGAALAAPVLESAGTGASGRKGVCAAVLAGAVIAACAVAGHLASVHGMTSVSVRGADLVKAALPFSVAGTACLFASAALLAVARGRRAMFAAAAVLATAGVFLVRLGFYGLQLNVGM